MSEEHDDLRDALRAYAEQRRLSTSLARDYDRIRRSRFFTLRTLWSSLRALVGGVSPSALEAGLPYLPDTALVGEDLEAEVIARWEPFAADLARRGDPLVSIVIPVFNKLDVTLRCLLALVATSCDGIAVEVIVVDDGSRDRTAEAIQSVPGLRFVGDGINRGFVGACNLGAAQARGRYLHFLNNDTAVREGWLAALLDRFEDDAPVGIVGSKLIYPDGTLQEAGGIVWRDATGWNYGRGGDPRDARYEYARPVDYCSGASILIRADLFRALGGFDARYAPAYYEDADLCFAVRAKGYRVIYEPRSEVVHFEGATSGTDITSGTKRYQEINRPKFREKWERELAAHAEGSPAAVARAARRLRTGATILVIDSHVPLYDRDAGSQRLQIILGMLVSSGYHVLFLPDNYAALQPYTSELQHLGIEVLHHSERGRSLNEALDEILPMLDAAWICRPELYEKYAKSIRRNRATKIIYDTIDLHFVRMQREAALAGTTALEAWRDIEQRELAAARDADATIVVTESERALLAERGIEQLYVVPTIHDIAVSEAPAFERSSGILFIGGYNHTPNVDAALWLCNEIMPRVWAQEPNAHVQLLGSNPPDAVRALASERVSVPGYIPDVTSYFASSRVFAAPLRFGAGIKGKVGHALTYGLPCVLTDVAAEGFDVRDGEHCLIANDAASFAAALVCLLRDRARWNALSERALEAIAPFTSEAIQPRIARMLDEILEARVSAAR